MKTVKELIDFLKEYPESTEVCLMTHHTNETMYWSELTDLVVNDVKCIDDKYKIVFTGD